LMTMIGENGQKIIVLLKNENENKTD